MKDEALNEDNISKPRIYIKNTGTESVSDFKAYYYITTEGGHLPVIEEYWLPSSQITVEEVTEAEDDVYRILYDFTGVTLSSGEVIPIPLETLLVYITVTGRIMTKPMIIQTIRAPHLLLTRTYLSIQVVS